MNIERKYIKYKNGIKWKVFVNGKERASGIIVNNKVFKTLKDKAKYEALCFINWFKETVEYEKLLKRETNGTL